MRHSRDQLAVPSRCAVCNRFFSPDSRTRTWQKTCGRIRCKKRNQRRQEAAWRDRSREHVRAYQQDRRESQRDAFRAYGRSYYAQRRDEIRSRQIPYQRGYRHVNRSVLAAKQRARYRRDPQKQKRQLREYRIIHRQALTTYQQQYRQLSKTFPGISPKEFQALKKARFSR